MWARAGTFMEISLDKIKIDPSIYPRISMDDGNVVRLMNALNTGAKLPPLIIDGATKRLIDGRHRYEAYKRLNRHTVEVEERTYKSERELYASAVILNIGHGAQFDVSSLNKVISALERFGYSKEKISVITRTPVAFLGDIMRGYKPSEVGKPIAIKGTEKKEVNYGARGGDKTVVQPAKPVQAYDLSNKAVFYAKYLSELIQTKRDGDSDAWVEAMSDLFTAWAESVGIEIDWNNMKAKKKNVSRN